MKPKFQLTDLRRYNEALVLMGVVLALGGLFSMLSLGRTAWWTVALTVLGVVILGLFMAANLGEVRETGKRRTTQVRANLSLLAIAALAIVVSINYIIQRHPVRFDMTSNKLYSLSPQTLDALKALKTDVTVTFFNSDRPQPQVGNEIARATQLLKEYEKHSSKFHLKMVDADKEPGEVQKFGIREYNVAVFESGANRRDVLQREYVTYAFNGRQPTPKFQGEQAFTNALLTMSDNSQKKILYFTQGHGERELANPQAIGLNTLKGLLDGANYDEKAVQLAQTGKIPEDCAVLAILGATKPFSTAEADAVRKWVEEGGKLLLCVDPNQNPGLDGLLGDLGVKFGRNVVLDKTSFAYPDLVNVIPQYLPHPITEKLSDGKVFVVLPFCRSVQKETPLLKDVTQTPLLITTAAGWGETDMKSPKPSFGPGDLKGPVTMAMAFEGSPAGKSDIKFRVAVFGTSSFLINAMANAPGNMDLAVNAINWAALQEGKISIRPKEDDQRVMNFTATTANALKILVLLVLPLLALGTGIYVWYRRRTL